MTGNSAPCRLQFQKHIVDHLLPKGTKTKKLILILTVLAAAGMAHSQEGRTEVTKPTADDSRANTDAVPEAYAISGKFERVVGQECSAGVPYGEGVLLLVPFVHTFWIGELDGFEHYRRGAVLGDVNQIDRAED